MNRIKTMHELVEAANSAIANEREDYSLDPQAGLAYDEAIDLLGRLVMKIGGDGPQSWPLGLQRMADVILGASEILGATDQAQFDRGFRELKEAMARLGQPGEG